MKNTKLLLGALAICSIASACDNPPPATDAGTDAFVPMTDGGGGDAGNDAAVVGNDSGVAPTCAGYCAFITATCTGGDAQYTDETDCMTQCTAAGWDVGTDADTSGNTLGCRIYHAIVASGAGMAATHCPHAGLLGGGVCSPFRTDAPVESATGYVRVDRMGMPAVATALIGPGLASAAAGATAKDDYNDSDPTGDASFTSGIPLLTAIGAYHQLLDAQLRTAHLTPCSVTTSFPVPGAPAPVPACGVQHYDGTDLTDPAGLTVASLILPDTLMLNTATATHFPNGRAPDDPVIDPILSVLLLNMSICAGTRTGVECPSLTTMTTCAADTNCSWTGTACAPAATSSAVVCAGIPEASCIPATTTCTWTGTACVPVPCEAVGAPATAAQCPAFAGCSASTCDTLGTRCTVDTLGGIPLNPTDNDGSTDLSTFPYFAPAN